jgi:type II secretory pathway component GspD/PulD (secretin)
MMSLLSGATRIRSPVLAILAFGLLSTVPTFARAETHISGKPDAFRMEVRNATLQEVLTDLRSSFGLQYKISTGLNRSVSGTYNGSLREVIARLLDGYDFFVRKLGDDLEVVVVGFSASSGIAPTPAVVVPIPGRASRRDF